MSDFIKEQFERKAAQTDQAKHSSVTNQAKVPNKGNSEQNKKQ